MIFRVSSVARMGHRGFGLSCGPVATFLVGRKRVERLMRNAGIEGVYRRRTRRHRRTDAVPSDDLVNRRFHPQGPDRLWVSDITEHPTREGKVYLAVVLDAWSRRIVGWSIADHLRTELVTDALDMAIWRRRPDTGSDLIRHSDHGTQLRFKGWSQHCLVGEIVATRRGLRWVCAIRGSCGAGC